MEQFTQFIIHQWPLFLALVVIIILIVMEEMRGNVRGVQKISPQDATQLINHEDAVVLDVRSEDAFQGGHIINAINIPHNKIEEQLKKLSKHKTDPIIIVCNVGQSSIAAGVKLRSHDFEKVYSLAGGIQAWKKASLPVTKK